MPAFRRHATIVHIGSTLGSEMMEGFRIDRSLVLGTRWNQLQRHALTVLSNLLLALLARAAGAAILAVPLASVLTTPAISVAIGGR